MKILALSGWGQPHDSLSDILPEAEHFDYSGYNSGEEAVNAISSMSSGYDAIIGWSLGGQLAVRSVAANNISHQKLILIGTPFQFVKTADIKTGMPQDQFYKFRDNYAKNAHRTLSKAWELIALNDINSDNIKKNLAKYDKEKCIEKDWLKWLDILERFSCNSLDFSNFPETLILHGNSDAVVSHSHAQEFSKRISLAKPVIINGAGHAPHWHDSGLIISYINDYLYGNQI